MRKLRLSPRIDSDTHKEVSTAIDPGTEDATAFEETKRVQI